MIRAVHIGAKNIYDVNNFIILLVVEEFKCLFQGIFLFQLLDMLNFRIVSFCNQENSWQVFKIVQIFDILLKFSTELFALSYDQQAVIYSIQVLVSSTRC